MTILQELYDSEINWRIDTFWDGGFFWYLGLSPEYKAEGESNNLNAAIDALKQAAFEHFPDSVFATSEKAAE